MTDDAIRSHLLLSIERVEHLMECAERHLGVERGGRRQLEVLALAGIGMTDRDIAEICGISRDTVGMYWARLMRRLEASTRTEAVALILQREIVMLAAAL